MQRKLFERAKNEAFTLLLFLSQLKLHRKELMKATSHKENCFPFFFRHKLTLTHKKTFLFLSIFVKTSERIQKCGVSVVLKPKPTRTDEPSRI